MRQLISAFVLWTLSLVTLYILMMLPANSNNIALWSSPLFLILILGMIAFGLICLWLVIDGLHAVVHKKSLLLIGAITVCICSCIVVAGSYGLVGVRTYGQNTGNNTIAEFMLLFSLVIVCAALATGVSTLPGLIRKRSPSRQPAKPLQSTPNAPQTGYISQKSSPLASMFIALYRLPGQIMHFLQNALRPKKRTDQHVTMKTILIKKKRTFINPFSQLLDFITHAVESGAGIPGLGSYLFAIAVYIFVFFFIIGILVGFSKI